MRIQTKKLKQKTIKICSTYAAPVVLPENYPFIIPPTLILSAEQKFCQAVEQKEFENFKFERVSSFFFDTSYNYCLMLVEYYEDN